MQLKKNSYIIYRKLKALCTRIVFLLCRVFPVKKNRVSICVFEGKGGFGCNPKYIVEELHKRNAEYEFIWFVNDMSKEFPDYIKKVPNDFKNRVYWLSTSKIWIDNYRKPYGVTKRKGQYYINTWHATVAFKSIGLWRKEAFSQIAYMVSKNDSDMIDDVVIDSEWCAEVYPKGLVYNGDFLWACSPRCDILYGNRTESKKRFRANYGLEEDSKVVMFAPTFREGSINGKRTVYSDVWTIDFERLLLNLEKRFGGKWYLCIRVHPQLAEKMEAFEKPELGKRIIDVSQKPDMHELLAGMDAFITDYSSAAMDASYAHIPVFIYADDIEKYVKDRGSILWDFSRDSYAPIKNNKEMTPDIDTVLPYSLAQNNEELEKNILEFNEDEYRSAMVKFEKDIKLIFDGNGSKTVADRIESFIYGGKNEKV